MPRRAHNTAKGQPEATLRSPAPAHVSLELSPGGRRTHSSKARGFLRAAKQTEDFQQSADHRRQARWGSVTHATHKLVFVKDTIAVLRDHAREQIGKRRTMPKRSNVIADLSAIAIDDADEQVAFGRQSLFVDGAKGVYHLPAAVPEPIAEQDEEDEQLIDTVSEIIAMLQVLENKTGGDESMLAELSQSASSCMDKLAELRLDCEDDYNDLLDMMQDNEDTAQLHRRQAFLKQLDVDIEQMKAVIESSSYVSTESHSQHPHGGTSVGRTREEMYAPVAMLGEWLRPPPQSLGRRHVFSKKGDLDGKSEGTATSTSPLRRFFKDLLKRMRLVLPKLVPAKEVPDFCRESFFRVEEPDTGEDEDLLSPDVLDNLGNEIAEVFEQRRMSPPTLEDRAEEQAFPELDLLYRSRQRTLKRKETQQLQQIQVSRSFSGSADELDVSQAWMSSVLSPSSCSADGSIGSPIASLVGNTLSAFGDVEGPAESRTQEERVSLDSSFPVLSPGRRWRPRSWKTMGAAERKDWAVEALQPAHLALLGAVLTPEKRAVFTDTFVTPTLGPIPVPPAKSGPERQATTRGVGSSRARGEPVEQPGLSPSSQAWDEAPGSVRSPRCARWLTLPESLCTTSPPRYAETSLHPLEFGP